MVDNPWLELPESKPYILPEDKDLIFEFNKGTQEEYFIHTDLYPEPYIGNKSAPVVLLNLNPGYDPRDRSTHANEQFKLSWKRNLYHEDQKYPFYYLNPNLPKDGGHEWWSKILRPILAVVPNEVAAKYLFCIEFFPYHSKEFKRKKWNLKGSTYARTLVQSSIAEHAIILLMRSRTLWHDLVPELKGYPHYYELNSPQNVILSANNCPAGFEPIVSTLQKQMRN